ncbi:YIP1 family protein [Limimaricola pyoseonensis]|uniref:Yip1 domain-containing protein n=1 Tax=Limimaricola pyoseonensis TaxID=521013 RepID=A0A1G7AN09_9RHOB|nr:YIP1 family protein [Limimaricola pyoseonensis]SDE15847.1 Yip1 domain-containing protein [Limimaricola pyoseonensis]
MALVADLLRLSLRAPREAGQRVMTLPLSRATVGQGLVLVTCLSVLLTALLQGAMPAVPTDGLPEPDMQGFGLSPFAYAGLLGTSLLLLAFGLSAAGRALGGSGRFDEALAIVVWLEVLAMLLRLIQGVTILVLPPLGGLIGLAGLVYLFWCLVQFTAALHGFSGPGRAVITLFLALIGIGATIALLLALTGIGLQGGLPNV